MSETLTLTFGSLNITHTLTDDKVVTTTAPVAAQPEPVAPKVRQPRQTRRTTPKAAAPKVAATKPASPKAKVDNKALLASIRQLAAEGRFDEATKLAQDRGWAQEVAAIAKKAASQEAKPAQEPKAAPKAKAAKPKATPKAAKTVAQKLTEGVRKANAKRLLTEAEPKRVTPKETAAKLDKAQVAKAKADDRKPEAAGDLLLLRKQLKAKVVGLVKAGITEDMLEAWAELTEMFEALDEAAEQARQDGEPATAEVLTRKASLYAEAAGYLQNKVEA